MREILFRGKTTDDEWVCGDYISIKQREKELCGIRDHTLLRNAHVCDRRTIGQYTGLTDKNGKMIFEGDIIRMNDCPEDIAEVCFGEFGCIDMETATATDLVLGWYYKVIPTDVLSRLNPFSLPFQMNTYWAKECAYEVIGNIYDNPELMDMKDSRRACYRNADSTPGRYYE